MDAGFGITFFLFRICFHFYLFAYAIYSGISIFSICILTLSCGLHIMWFNTWVQKYGKSAFGLGKMSGGGERDKKV